MLRRLTLATISGLARTPKGEPIPGATVKATIQVPIDYGENGPTSWRHEQVEAKTDASGRFSLPPQRPDRRITLTVSRDNYHFLSGGAISGLSEPKSPSGATAPVGPVSVTDAVLVPLTGKVSGQVLSSKGVPVAGALVVAPEGGATTKTSTDKNGTFSLSGLPPDTVRLVAVFRTGYAEAVVKPGGAPPVLMLAPARKALPAAGDRVGGLQLLEEIRRAQEDKNSYAAKSLYYELIPFDPEQALSLTRRASSIRMSDWDLVQVLMQAAEADPGVRGVEWELSHLGDIKDTGKPRLTALRELALCLAERNHPRAPALLAQAYQATQAAGALDETGVNRAYQFAYLAALAARLGKTSEATAWTERAATATQEWEVAQAQKKETQSGMWGSVAEVLVRGGDLQMARQFVAGRVPEKERSETYRRILPQVARHSPTLALGMLGEIEKAPVGPDQSADFSFSQAALPVVRSLAKQDPAAALALARRIKYGETRPVALALAARVQKTPAAITEAFEEAGASALASHESAALLARVASMALPIDPKAAAVLFRKAKERFDAAPQMSGYWVGPFAFYYARHDPAEARLVLETAWAEALAQPEAGGGTYRLTQIVQAMTAIDTDRARDMVREVPVKEGEGEYNPRYEAQRSIARYLLAPETLRRALSFDAWRAYGAWTRQEE